MTKPGSGKRPRGIRKPKRGKLQKVTTGPARPRPNDPAAAPAALQPAIRVVMMPRDANYLGTIFGGVILSLLDLAAAVEAHRHSDQKLVTVAMHEVKFIAPVFVSDLVSFYTETLKIGTTSITVRVTVDARRARPPHATIRVTHAEIIFVAIDDLGRPTPVRPTSVPFQA